MNLLVVGGGKIVYFLCRALISKGHAVTVVNRDRDECVQLARRLKATVVEGEGSDPRILEEAGAPGADAVLVVTPNDPDNLVICQLAALRYGVPRTLALVNDPDNEAAFKQLGVAAFSTTHLVANLIEQRAALDEIVSLVPAAEGRVNISEIVLKASSPLVGRPLSEAGLPEDALVACVLRGERAIVPRGNTALAAGDRIILITLPENHGRVLRMVTGERI